MTLKIIIISILAIILYCLGSGLFYLVRGGSESSNLAKALTWRILLSLALFALMMLSYFFGWITPHPVTAITP